VFNGIFIIQEIHLTEYYANQGKLDEIGARLEHMPCRPPTSLAQWAQVLMTSAAI
jgi:hypothetical protein